MKSRLTAKEKEIAYALFWKIGGLATSATRKAARLKARGHYWHQDKDGEFVAFSPKGRMRRFLYGIVSQDAIAANRKIEKLARSYAKKWANGEKFVIEGDDIVYE